MSSRLAPRTGAQPYVIVRETGANAFFLGDVATQTMVTGFAQPVSGDNLVPIEIPELGEAIDQKVELSIDGQNGEILKQGRVLIKLDDGEEAWKDLAEDDFLWR